jgi:hypothetical protein
MKEHFDFNAQMLNLLLNKTTSDKIQFSDTTNWHNSHPYYRLNYYNGIQISQVMGIYLLFNKDFLSLFSNIVEIGSYNGGLSSYLYDTKSKDSLFVSYDIAPEINTAKPQRPEIDFRIGDCFEKKYFDEIVSHIVRPGKTLMICDGGNKTKEFNEFSKYLKKDDIIILHDYKHYDTSFEEACQYWQWPYGNETHYDEIKDSVSKNGLNEYNSNVFNFFMWGAYIKK